MLRSRERSTWHHVGIEMAAIDPNRWDERQRAAIDGTADRTTRRQKVQAAPERTDPLDALKAAMGDRRVLVRSLAGGHLLLLEHVGNLDRELETVP